MTDRDTHDRLTSYLEHLTSILGAEPSIHHLLPIDQRSGDVLALAYMDVPKRGYVTGITYGLSGSVDPDRSFGGRELSITIRSEDIEWAIVPARMVASLRGKHPFNRGQALGYAGRFTEGSPMSSVLLAEPAIYGLSKPINIALDVQGVDGGDLVEILGVYPIHPSERDFVYASGFDAFWGLKWDRFDPSRPPVM